MKKYFKPELNEELIELEDIIATSNGLGQKTPGTDYDPNTGDEVVIA